MMTTVLWLYAILATVFAYEWRREAKQLRRDLELIQLARSNKGDMW